MILNIISFGKLLLMLLVKIKQSVLREWLRVITDYITACMGMDYGLFSWVVNPRLNSN